MLKKTGKTWAEVFIALALLFCFISTVYAFENYAVGEEINVVITLLNDTGTELIPVEDQVCNGSVYFYGNTSWIIQDVLLMNHTGGLHNFTFTLGELGEYGIFIECWVNSELATYQRKIEILNTTIGGGNETLQNLIYNETIFLVEEEKMIGTTILFGIVVLIALLFLVFAVFGVGRESYFDVLSAFIAPTILMLIGYQCFASEALQQFEFLGMLFIVIAAIIYIYAVIKVFTLAIEEFGWQDDETERSPDYEYK